MKNLTLNEAIKETQKVCRKFPNSKKWALINVDLDKEYPKVLKQLEKRIKAGEFDHD